MKEVCSLDGCDKEVRSVGLCNRHYLRKRRHGSPLAGAKFRKEACPRRQQFRSEAKCFDAAIARCTNPEARDYVRYGARGIKFCDRWRESFDHFLEDMGPKPKPSLTLDRIDNDGNYEPGNCRWATCRQQANNRRNSRIFEFRGRQMTSSEIAEIAGIAQTTFFMRVEHYGWDVDEAATWPVGKRREF